MSKRGRNDIEISESIPIRHRLDVHVSHWVPPIRWPLTYLNIWRAGEREADGPGHVSGLEYSGQLLLRDGGAEVVRKHVREHRPRAHALQQKHKCGWSSKRCRTDRQVHRNGVFSTSFRPSISHEKRCVRGRVAGTNVRQVAGGPNSLHTAHPPKKVWIFFKIFKQ